MSEKYKQYIDDLCNKADNGDSNAAKKLLDEAAYWSAKNKQLIKDKMANKNKDE